MTKNIKTYLTLPVVLAAASLLVVGGVAHATGSVPASVTGGAKARVNNAVSAGSPLTKEAKGVKQFGVDATAALVSDEGAVTPTTGGLVGLEIAQTNVGSALPVCYLLIYDSSVAADTTESGSVSRLLVPPLAAALSQMVNKEFQFPKQFHKGLVVLMGGSGAANCRGTIGWTPNGGLD